MKKLIMMCLTNLILCVQPVLAQDTNEEIEIHNKCIASAQSYAKEQDGPWSSDARFGFMNNYICTVVVSEIGYDGQLCHPTYSVSLKSWKVTQVNYAGCIDQN